MNTWTVNKQIGQKLGGSMYAVEESDVVHTFLPWGEKSTRNSHRNFIIKKKRKEKKNITKR